MTRENGPDRPGFHTVKTVIDIGNDKIKGIIGEMTYAGADSLPGVSILKYVEIPGSGMEKSEITDELSLSAVIARTLENLKINDGPVEKVTLGLGGTAFRTARKNGLTIAFDEREITEKEIEDFYEAAERELLKPGDRVVHREMYNIKVSDDNKTIPSPLGRKSSQLRADVYFVYMEEALCRRYERLMKKIPDGPEIEDVMANGYAAAMATLRNEDKTNGVVLVDIGEGSTDIVMFKYNRLLFFDSFKLGTMHFVMDLCSLPEYINYIEQEKRCTQSVINKKYAREFYDMYLRGEIGDNKMYARDGVACRGEYVRNIIELRCEQLAREIKDRVPELKGGFRGIVLTGGGARVPGVAEKIRTITKYPVKASLPVRINGLTEVNERMSAVIGLFGEAIEKAFETIRRTEAPKVAETPETTGDVKPEAASAASADYPEKAPEPAADAQAVRETTETPTKEVFLPPDPIPPVTEPPAGSGETAADPAKVSDEEDEKFRTLLSGEAVAEKKPEKDTGGDGKEKIGQKLKDWWKRFAENYKA